MECGCVNNNCKVIEFLDDTACECYKGGYIDGYHNGIYTGWKIMSKYCENYCPTLDSFKSVCAQIEQETNEVKQCTFENCRLIKNIKKESE